MGSVGCCDPARPWQYLGVHSSGPLNGTRALARRPLAAAANAKLTAQGAALERAAHRADLALVQGLPAQLDPPPTAAAYALFTESILSGLKEITLTLNGSVIAQHKVSGPAADYYAKYYGESTRLFPWDKKGGRFVFADVDFAKTPPPLTIYTIEAATGKSTSAPVSGCGDAGEYRVM